MDNSGVVSVGRRSSGRTDAGPSGAVYSTMAGGECDGWHFPCSWKQQHGADTDGLQLKTKASTDCVRAALRGRGRSIGAATKVAAAVRGIPGGHAVAEAEAVAARLVGAAFAACLVP